MLSKVKQKPKSKLSLQTLYKLKRRDNTTAAPHYSVSWVSCSSQLEDKLNCTQSTHTARHHWGINPQILIFTLPLPTIISSQSLVLGLDQLGGSTATGGGDPIGLKAWQ